MASLQTDSEKYVNEALELVAKEEPEDYAKFIAEPDQLAALKTETKKTVDELLKTINNVRQMEEKQVTIAEAFKHLSKERIYQITSSFRNQTFTMRIDDKGGVKHAVTKHGEDEFFPVISLPSSDASELQISSVVVECAIFILDAMGLSVPDDARAMKKAIDYALKVLKNPVLMKAVEELENAHKSGSHVGMAKAILKIAIDLFKEGAFLKIAKDLLSNKKWYKWIIYAAKITAFLLALIASGGVAEIAEIVSLLVNATKFLLKLIV